MFQLCVKTSQAFFMLYDIHDSTKYSFFVTHHSEIYLFGSLGLLACSTMETAVVFQIASGKAEWFRKSIFPSLLLLSGRSHWETLMIGLLSFTYESNDFHYISYFN